MFGSDRIYNIEYVELNGQKQCISIRYEKPNLPILLYLHGGPGDTAMPLISKYNKPLSEAYTVVVWEQRGAGKSYYDFSLEPNINMDMFISDVLELTKLLLKKFKQDKIYLVGHSWGSVLGLRFLEKYSDLVQMYIGCGQVVNMRKGSELAKDYAIQMNLKSNNKKIAEKLNKIDCSYTNEDWLNELLFVTKQVVKNKGSLYGEKNYNKLAMDYIFSSDYSLTDLIKRQKGSLQSIKYLWNELMEINFENITEYKVPIVFIEGRYDFHVSSKLTKEYYNKISTSKQMYWFEKSCHFPQWSEANKFNSILTSFVR